MQTDNEFFAKINGYLAYVIDPVHDSRLKILTVICLVIIGASLIANSLRYVGARLVVRFQTTVIKNLRVHIYNRITSLPVSYFIDTQKGFVLSRLITDTVVIQRVVTDSFFVLMREPVKVFIFLFIMFRMSWQLTLGSMIIVPILGLFISMIVKRMKADAHETQVRLGNLMSILDETINGIKVIYGFTAVKTFQKKFGDENQRYLRSVMSMTRKTDLASPVSEFLSTIMVSVIVFGGGLLIFSHNNTLDAEQFIVFIVIVSQLMQPIKQTARAFTGVQEGIVSGERILDILDFKQRDQSTSQRPTPKFDKNIQFKDIKFGYGGDRNHSGDGFRNAQRKIHCIGWAFRWWQNNHCRSPLWVYQTPEWRDPYG